MEDQVLGICAQNGIFVPVYGKRSGHLPHAWEHNPKILGGIAGLVDVQSFRETMLASDVRLPSRPPTFCAGCPHRGMYAATKRAVGYRDVVYCSDIGCYILGVAPPFQIADFIICMGGQRGRSRR